MCLNLGPLLSVPAHTHTRSDLSLLLGGTTITVTCNVSFALFCSFLFCLPMYVALVVLHGRPLRPLAVLA